MYLQKLTLKGCVDEASIKMLAPAQKTVGSAEPTITAFTSGCSKRRRWTASHSSMSTPRSYELSLSRYVGGLAGRVPSSDALTCGRSSCTARTRRATAPSTESFQWT